MFNALESIQAFEAGKTQRKDRERETAMKSIGNALAGGDITGAASQAFAVDPMYGMQIQQYGDGRNALALRKDIGGMLAGGDRKGAAAKAYGAGEFEMGANIDAQIAQMTQQQRQDALFLSGELGNAALTLQGITDPQQRAAQWQQMQGRFVNDFGMDPAALAQFDPMDDTALQRAIGEAQSFSDRLAGQRADQMFNYTMGQDEQAQSNWERSFAADEAERRATAEARATPSTNRERAEDQNGVLRYLDTGEAVFPDVTTAEESAKPLIGSEAMARVTSGLPNAIKAVEDLDRLVFRSKGTSLSSEGYDPASDWGAATIEAIPDFGLLKGVARTVGGEDYQLFKDSYGSFEAAMLPIISGAAITESEGLRQMRALEIKPGDSEQTKTRKIAGMRAMVKGVEMAARGDTAGFISMLDQAGSISGAGPVERDGAAATTPAKPTGKVAPELEGYSMDGDPITEDDIQTTMRENGMTRAQVIAALKGEGQ
jgi:hypothetical protein